MRRIFILLSERSMRYHLSYIAFTPRSFVEYKFISIFLQVGVANIKKKRNERKRSKNVEEK